jgi:ankyrin repeat protein
MINRTPAVHPVSGGGGVEMEEEHRGWRWLLAIGALAVVAAAFAVWWFFPGQQQKRRNAALIEAARSGDVSAVEAALDQGGDVNARDADGLTPLMHAAHGDRPDIANPAPTDHPEVVDILIRRGADANAKTESGFVALFWAARFGHGGVAKVLIAHGADVNAKDKDGMTALIWAATNQQAKVVELLKEAGSKE